jgi:hypothetical protein
MPFRPGLRTGVRSPTSRAVCRGRARTNGTWSSVLSPATVPGVPLEGGQPTPVLKLPAHRRSRLSPDGRRIIYQAGEVRGEIWVLTKGSDAGGSGY